MNVFKIVAKAFLCMLRITTSNGEIPGGACANLVSDMRWEDVLAITPANIDLDRGFQNHIVLFGFYYKEQGAGLTLLCRI